MMLRTSHVGSFPLPHSRENSVRIIRDLWDIGLDAPPYPQLRNFIEIYLEPLVSEGMLLSRNGFYFLRDSDLDDLVSWKPEIPEAEDMIGYIRRNNIGFKWLRAPVTGPFTLGSRIYLSDDVSLGIKNTAVSDKKLIESLAEYVRIHLEYMDKLGYNILFVDDPVLGIIVGKRRILFNYSEEEIIEIYEHIFHGRRGEHGIHVCGRISPRLVKILSSIKNLDIMNFEFRDNPQNINVIDSELLISNNKVLAPGIASSKKPIVETIDELRELLVTIGEKAGWRIDLVSADCGFGGLASETGDPWEAYDIGLKKLKNIVETVRIVENIRS